MTEPEARRHLNVAGQLWTRAVPADLDARPHHAHRRRGHLPRTRPARPRPDAGPDNHPRDDSRFAGYLDVIVLFLRSVVSATRQDLMVARIRVEIT